MKLRIALTVFCCIDKLKWIIHKRSEESKFRNIHLINDPTNLEKKEGWPFPCYRGTNRLAFDTIAWEEVIRPQALAQFDVEQMDQVQKEG